jgi:GT2 family glycosyltransferase
MANISFAITAHNEHVELERLLRQLAKNIKKGDEIVVQLDSTATPEVKEVVDNFSTIK